MDHTLIKQEITRLTHALTDNLCVDLEEDNDNAEMVDSFIDCIVDLLTTPTNH